MCTLKFLIILSLWAIFFILWYSSRPRQEQSLVKWASSRLHDRECLERMVDPGIKGTFSSRSLSQFADIVSLCIQVLLNSFLHLESHKRLILWWHLTFLNWYMSIGWIWNYEQPEKEFRPPMSEIVDSLTRLVQKHCMSKTGGADYPEVDPFERSFRSTQTRFMGSPTVSYMSAWCYSRLTGTATKPFLSLKDF